MERLKRRLAFWLLARFQPGCLKDNYYRLVAATIYAAFRDPMCHRMEVSEMADEVARRVVNKHGIQ